MRAPANAPLMSTNARAASADEFSIDSMLTKYMYPYL
jgi:hypothetical protein